MVTITYTTKWGEDFLTADTLLQALNKLIAIDDRNLREIISIEFKEKK